MAVKVCLFNHKGGVGKTTTAFHLGWMLAKMGKRVLLVDADSQCNLTNLVLSDEKFETFYNDFPKENIKEYLAPVFESRPVRIEAAKCQTTSFRDGLFLIPGSFDISEYEVSLGMSFSASDAIVSLRNQPGSFNCLIEKTVKKNNIDVVLVDLNPSLGAINQALFLSCDYFLIPTMADSFSVMALRSLARILPRWEKWARHARNVFEEAIYPFPKSTPKFLGVSLNRYQIKGGKQESRVPSGANQAIINDISRVLRETLVPALTGEKMTMPQDFYQWDEPKHQYIVGMIQDFHSLNACYHKFGVPVFDFTDEQMREFKHTGNLQRADKKIMESVEKPIEQICEKIVRLPDVSSPPQKREKVKEKSAFAA